jgi:uncharacterized zinc-type alcohol dehydrogenase-like protein
MLPTKAYAAYSAGDLLKPFEFSRRTLGENDVAVEILYCGVCHSDIHQARGEWGNSTFPMVPGHEIVGRVSARGTRAGRLAIGDIVGIGCFVDSCRSCSSCQEGEEQYCQGHVSFTYNGTEQDQRTPTQGGYSSHIVVDERYALKVSPTLNLSAVAPLLCAGITTYSPLRHWKVGKGDRLGILGLGGLGHMGVKFGVAFGAEVTVISTSPKKKADAERLGAHDFLVLNDDEAVSKAAEKFDYIIDTVSAEHDMNRVLNLIRRDGTLIVVGVPPKAPEIHPFSLIPRRRRIAGSMIGGLRETQEMLDYCAEHDIVSDVEVISIADINTAYERMIRGDVRYRFVIDAKTLK